MTGFGTASIQKDEYEVIAEIRTLNSKFADIAVRIPAQWSSLELILRKQLSEGLVRGKISLSLEIVSNASSSEAIFDEELLADYLTKFKLVSSKLDEEPTDLFSLALHAPGVLKVNEEGFNEDLVELIKEAVDQSIARTNEFRLQEGKELSTKLSDYITTIRDLLGQVNPLDKERIELIEERLRQGFANNNANVDLDKNRFEQELIYYIEKLDINEEIVRLANHLDYFEEIMQSDKPNGKKLGFVSQEMGREINTIGSKANNAPIQRIVVEMKEELEKIKEQSLNLL
jgi:uncharacterized protein (TIGR00255 family)